MDATLQRWTKKSNRLRDRRDLSYPFRSVTILEQIENINWMACEKPLRNGTN